MNGHSEANNNLMIRTILIKLSIAILLGSALALLIFVLLHDENISYEHEWQWYFKDQPPLTMDSFEFRHPDTNDPQVMLQLAYKMMQANRPIHAFALIGKVFDIADATNDQNLKADAHYTYGTIKFMGPPKQYRFVLEELRKNDSKFKARGIPPRSENYGNLFGDFSEAISLYKSMGNLVGLTGSYYRMATILDVIGGEQLYRCAYLYKARETNKQIESAAEKTRLNTLFFRPGYDDFETQLIEAENSAYNSSCHTLNFQNDPALLEKGLSLYGWRTGFAELKSVSYETIPCRETCEDVWQAWLAPIQEKVEVPDYEH